jgi:hypothetical protein
MEVSQFGAEKMKRLLTEVLPKLAHKRKGTA